MGSPQQYKEYTIYIYQLQYHAVFEHEWLKLETCMGLIMQYPSSGLSGTGYPESVFFGTL